MRTLRCMWKRGLVVALGAGLLLAVGGQEASAQPSPPGQTACPEGGTKIDEEGPSEFRCPEGQVVTGICVKAGRPGFGVGDGATENGPGCYEYSELGGAGGGVGGGGTSRECKGISYSVYYCGPGEPPQEPVCGNEIVEDGEECDPPGPLGEGLACNEVCEIVEVPQEPVCGNEVVEDGEECDPPRRIDEGLVCNEVCEIVEVPAPEPEPVCGNEVIEAGEDCDPPGPINEALRCDEACQIVENQPEGGEGGE